MAITTPPVVPGFTGNAPNRVTGIPTFSVDMDTYLGEMQPNVDGENLLADWMNDEAVPEVTTKAAEAAQSATDSQTAETNSANSAIASQSSANNSEASAIQSANSAATASADFTATSSTSLLIEVASKTFAIETGKGFVIGQIVKAASSADPANEMSGEVTAASSGSITLLITQTGGSGTFSDWSISINNPTINDFSTSASEVWSSSKIDSTKADLESPVLTGSPESTLAPLNDDSNRIATTSFVKQEIDASTAGVVVLSNTVVSTPVSFVDLSLPDDGVYQIELNELAHSGGGTIRLICGNGGSLLTGSHSNISAGLNTNIVQNISETGQNYFRWGTTSGTIASAVLWLVKSGSSIQIHGQGSKDSLTVYNFHCSRTVGVVDFIRVLGANGNINSGSIVLRKYPT